jgi:hypothetical protein
MNNQMLFDQAHESHQDLDLADTPLVGPDWMDCPIHSPNENFPI